MLTRVYAYVSQGKRWLSRSLQEEKFIRSAVLLMTGTAAGQAIVILLSPVLTRLYSPSDFGILAVYTSLLHLSSSRFAQLHSPQAEPI